MPLIPGGSIYLNGEGAVQPLYYWTQNTIYGVTNNTGFHPIPMTNKEKKPMAQKFYRLKKDTPAWLAGAILRKGYDGDNYSPISDLWNTEAAEKCDTLSEIADLVESSPDWFEKVHEVSVLGKAKYLATDAARDAYAKLHKA